MISAYAALDPAGFYGQPLPPPPAPHQWPPAPPPQPFNGPPPNQ